MTFRNGSMLFGLLAVLVPVLIHLFSRRRAKRIDWGASLFLMGSLLHRSRKILIEEVLALVLRCLLVAVVALTMSRPFLPAGATHLWGLLVPAILLAAVCVGVGTAARRRKVWRWALYGAAAALLATCLLLSAGQHSVQVRRWTGSGGGQDIAILVDTSNSMGLTAADRPNFQRAVDEVYKLIDARSPGDQMMLVAAGAFPERACELTDRDDELRAALAELTPDAGVMDPVAALRETVERMKDTPNALKTFVFFTDAQELGWHSKDEARWREIAELLESYPQPPHLIFRTLPLPETFDNIAVSDLQLTRNVVGTGRAVGIKVTVENTGRDRSIPFELRLHVGDGPVLAEAVGTLAPGASESVRFRHRFIRPGPRPIRAFAPYEDDIAADNTDALVVRVVERFPVLVVDGYPATKVLDSAAGFVRVALAPPAETDGTAAKVSSLVEVTTVAATDIRDTFDFSPYRVVVLADVPRLPGSVAESLARFVSEGGGLLVAPGANAKADFYNEWVSPDGLPMAGARLTERRVFPDESPATVDPFGLAHRALETVSDSDQSDIDRALFSVYWVLRPTGDDAQSPAARFATGDPFFVERRVGEGRVVTTAFALDARDSNCPALSCFVPFVHELVYHAAGVDAGAVSMTADARGTFWLSPAAVDTGGTETNDAGSEASGAGEGEPREPEDITFEGPDHALHAGLLERSDGAFAFHVPQAHVPGIYRVHLPLELTSRMAPLLDRDGMLPFAVRSSVEESRLTTLSKDERQRIDGRLGAVRLDSSEELLAAIRGGVPGQEVWRILALAGFILVLAEAALVRWIARQRRGADDRNVSFSAQTGEVTSHQAAMWEKLKPK